MRLFSYACEYCITARYFNHMDAVEDIKSRLSIEDIVGEYVELKRAGRNFKALSPFANEKTPSLMISPEKQIWHDFSSGKGGNMFSWVMEMEGLDFKGALEHLARKAGIDLSQYRSGQDSGRGQLKERLFEAHEQACKFYQVQFSKNQMALEYIFKKRKFTKETALAFRIGYAPNNGTALSDYLKSKGFTPQELKSGGLAVERRGRLVDMFRGRLMVPLMDGQGKVLGFTARILEDDPNAPKYLNTPQTPLYDKSRHVFGLHLAKDAIRKSKYAVVVEGNLDVLASWQAGIQQVVATAGTAATEMHFKALGRFTNDVRLAFDQDKAGLNATERAIPLAAKANVTLSIITIPSGKDPDELVRQDPEAWRAITNKHVYALDWLMGYYQKQLDLTSAVGKREFSDVMLRTVRGLKDQVEQDHYAGKIADILQVSKEALVSKLKGGSDGARTYRKPKADIQIPDKQVLDQTKAQNQLLSLALMLPSLREYLQPLTAEMLSGEDAGKLLEFLQANPDYACKAASGLSNIGDYVKILSLLYEELYQHLELLELQYEAARLQVRLIERYVKFKKAEIAHELRDAPSESEQQKLLQKAKTLDALLHLTKEGETNAQS
jgi:DNA primase